MVLEVASLVIAEVPPGDNAPTQEASQPPPAAEEDNNEEEKETHEDYGDEDMPAKRFNASRKPGIFASMPFHHVENIGLSILGGRSRQSSNQAYFEDNKENEGGIILAWMQSIREHKFHKQDEDAATATTVGGSERSLSPENGCTTLDNTYSTGSSQNQLSEVLNFVQHFIQDRISTFKRNILHLRSKSKDSTFERNIQHIKRTSFGKSPTTDTFKRNIEHLKTLSKNSNS